MHDRFLSIHQSICNEFQSSIPCQRGPDFGLSSLYVQLKNVVVCILMMGTHSSKYAAPWRTVVFHAVYTYPLKDAAFGLLCKLLYRIHHDHLQNFHEISIFEYFMTIPVSEFYISLDLFSIGVFSDAYRHLEW